MENNSFSLSGTNEDHIKTRNLLFSMDYDSGYISHNPESNLDFSSENTANSTNSYSTKHIYLSEDALLETPEFCKYSNISMQIEKEDFEETRNVFSSPILSSSTTTHVSGSIASGCSQELSYSGFNSDESDVSVDIPYAKQIIVDNIRVQNTKNSLYNTTDSPDNLQDLNREVIKHSQQMKSSAFTNITNTLSSGEAKKKLTLIFSRNDKENVYNVKRKYPSLTPPDKKVLEITSKVVQTPKKPAEEILQNEENVEQQNILNTQNSNLEDFSDQECLKCFRCNADISEEYSMEENISHKSEISVLNDSTEQTSDIKLKIDICTDSLATSAVNENTGVVTDIEKDEENKVQQFDGNKDTIKLEPGIKDEKLGTEVPLLNSDEVKQENRALYSLETQLHIKDEIFTSNEGDSVKEIQVPALNNDEGKEENNVLYSLETELHMKDEITSNEDDGAKEIQIYETSSEPVEFKPEVQEVKSVSGTASELVELNPQVEEVQSANFELNENNLIKSEVKLVLQNVLDILENRESQNVLSLDKLNEIVKNNTLDRLNELNKKEEHCGSTDNEHNISTNTQNQSLNEEMGVSIKNETNISNKSAELFDIIPKTITSTPEKSYQNPMDSSLSPDLFTEDVVEEKHPEIVETPSSIPKERNVVKKDYMILRRAQNNLKGVIPPRSVTLIKITVPEMLKKIQCNQKYFWDNSTATRTQDDIQSNSLLVTSSMESCKNPSFPGILKDRGLGLYHNRSKFSEQFEELCVKYGQRYVGAETQSSCTIFDMNTVSPTKRKNMKPQWNTKSPGKRLSHLARRRITFSSANLQSGSSFLAGSRARQILVDAKRMDLLSRRRSPQKSPRKTPKKTPRKSPRIKTRTPSSSAKKKLALRFRKVTGEIEKSTNSSSFDPSAFSAKRTLFHSPDEDKKLNRFIPSTSGASTLDNEHRKSNPKRTLFMSPSKSSPLKSLGFRRSPVKRLDFGLEKKRKRTDSNEEIPAKFARCHSDIAPSSDLDVRTLSGRARSEMTLSQSKQIKELTTNHKKKLQLAIYEALRTQNILPTNPKFKIFASNLGRLTRKLFLMTTADCVGVTEKMLRIARHHVFSVVKGRSPEEIYEEFMKQKVKNLKPQGYVAPPEPIAEEPEANRRASLLGKTGCGENKVDRIRKAINFGGDEDAR